MPAVKTRKSNSLLFSMLVIASIGTGFVVAGNAVSIFDKESKRISDIKTQNGNCRFTLESTWTPAVRKDVEISYVFGNEIGNPNVAVTPWIINRVAPCATDVRMAVSQTVYGGNKTSCAIRVNGAIVSRRPTTSSRLIECSF